MLAMLQELAIVDNNPPIEDMPPYTAPQAPAANAVTHTNVHMEMLRILQEMQQSNVSRSRRGRRGGRGGRGGRGRGSRKRNRRIPDNTSFPRRITDKYCHTHGGCNHVSGDFTRKADGHNAVATM